MHSPRIIPCLLLDGDRLVKTTRFSDPHYVGDPVNILSIFSTFEVDEIALLDISAARRRVPATPELLAKLAEECFVPLAYGGGLTRLEDIDRIFSIGYEKVILNSSLADDPDLVSRAAETHGRQAIVASIDVRGDGPGTWIVHTRGATRTTGSDPVSWAQRAETLGVGEILLTAVDREGTMGGFDLPLVDAVADAVGIPVIAHGGAGKRAQLGEPLRQAGAAAVAAGSLFVYQGTRRGVLINYPNRRQIERLLSGGEPRNA